MRLKIPRGWAILDNKFYDTDPIAEEGSKSISNWHEGFVEDVLWIKECQINENKEYETPKLNYFDIDISWLPDSSIEGKYYATLSWCELENIIEIEKLESKDRIEIRNKIEFWMSDIKGFNSVYKAKLGVP